MVQLALKDAVTRENKRQLNFLMRCVNSGTAICNVVYASPAGCIVHRPSYHYNFTYLAVYGDVIVCLFYKQAYLVADPGDAARPHHIPEPGTHNTVLLLVFNVT